MLTFGRSPNDPIDLSLERLTKAPRPHKEYLLHLAKNIKYWRAEALRARRKYQADMIKYQAKRVHIPHQLGPGDFVYLSCPFISSKYAGIRRLATNSKGPFLITDIKDGRLVRLARVSDLTELDRWIAISRVKLTHLGMKPPKFTYDEHLTAEMYNDWIPDEAQVNQPWDEDSQVF